jgi:transcriptional regulator of arginine metabolism
LSGIPDFDDLTRKMLLHFILRNCQEINKYAQNMQKFGIYAYFWAFKLNNYSFMKNRSERIRLIKKLISQEAIGNQDDLQNRLQEQGCEVTQATLSRDLKSLHVIKVSDNDGAYIYRVVENGSAGQKANEDLLQGNFLADGVLDIDFSANLGVVKTLPGYASGVALMIDKTNTSELLGTIAGDDTILLIVREGISRDVVIELLKKAMPAAGI